MMNISLLKACRKVSCFTFVLSRISLAYLIIISFFFFSTDPLGNRGTIVLRDTLWETQHHTEVRDYCHHCFARFGQCFGYHSVLGLQFNLQSIHGASQFNDLLLVALLLLSAGHHLLAQLFHLKHSQRPSKDIMKGKLDCVSRAPENRVNFLFLNFLPSLPVCWTTLPHLCGLSPWWTHIDISFLVEPGLGQQKGHWSLQCWVCPQAGSVRNWFPMERKECEVTWWIDAPLVFLFQSNSDNLA